MAPAVTRAMGQRILRILLAVSLLVVVLVCWQVFFRSATPEQVAAAVLKSYETGQVDTLFGLTPHRERSAYGLTPEKLRSVVAICSFHVKAKSVKDIYVLTDLGRGRATAEGWYRLQNGDVAQFSASAVMVGKGEVDAVSPLTGLLYAGFYLHGQDFKSVAKPIAILNGFRKLRPLLSGAGINGLLDPFGNFQAWDTVEATLEARKQKFLDQQARHEARRGIGD